MVDRFYGFRFELKTIDPQLDLNIVLLERADVDACFGWIQRPFPSVFVGEVRCSKIRGQNFYQWMQTLEGIRESHFKVRDLNIRKLWSFTCIRFMKIRKFDFTFQHLKFWSLLVIHVSLIPRINARI